MLDFILKHIIKNPSTSIIIVICIVMLALYFGDLMDSLKHSFEWLQKVINFFKVNKDKLILIIFIFCIVFNLPILHISNKSNDELILINDKNEKIYPIAIDIKKKKKVGDWTYFIYTTEEVENPNNKSIVYPALYRYKNDEKIAKKVNELACYDYFISNNCVYYLDSTLSVQSHGYLWVSRPDGKNERMLNNEIYKFQIVDDKYIYYSYCFDTTGVGIEGHALHRMNIDGSNDMITAYEVSSDILKCSHFEYKIKNGWIYYNNFKMELGNPANGCEKVVMNEIGDNDWIFYITNQLIKARRDGSERIILDGEDTFDYEINKVEDNFIYYRKHGIDYRIDVNGNNKELIEQ